MQTPYKRTAIKCCLGCQSRSVEPNCHSYCPTYLAEKMALDEESAAAKKKAAVMHGISDQRWGTYLRKLKSKR